MGTPKGKEKGADPHKLILTSFIKENMQLKFSPANAKTYQLANTPLKSYLAGNRKIYSLDYSSALSCPGAEKCLARIIIENGKRKIWDSPKQEYRCFSLSSELAYTNVYNLRKHNFDIMRKIPNCILMAEKILSDMPKDLSILRHSVAGDFFNYEYFKAVNIVASQRPNILIYAYTKSSNYWVRYLDEFGPIEKNLVLTHSIGSKFDKLAEERGLRTARVVYSE